MRFLYAVILFCLIQALYGCAGFDVPKKNEPSDHTPLVQSENGEAEAGFASGLGSSVGNTKRVGGETYARSELSREELLACGISDSKLVDPQPMAMMAERFHRMQMELEANQASTAPPKAEQQYPPQRNEIERLKERLNQLKMYAATKRPNIVRVTGVTSFRDPHLNAYVKQVMPHLSTSLDRVRTKSAWQDQARVRFALQLDDKGRIYALEIVRKSGHDDLDFAVALALCEAQPYPNRPDDGESQIDLVEFVRTVTFSRW